MILLDNLGLSKEPSINKILEAKREEEKEMRAATCSLAQSRPRSQALLLLLVSKAKLSHTTKARWCWLTAWRTAR